jgi:YVTN family beta-propeller protein
MITNKFNHAIQGGSRMKSISLHSWGKGRWRPAVLAALIILLSAAPALAGSFSFTTTDDWATGTLTNVNSDPPPATGDGHLRLNDAVLTPFNHIWVALSGRGTAARINTDHVEADGRVTLAESAAGAGAVYGEYRTAPEGQPTDPSRTTVDKNGDVWVGNRAQGSGLGSVVKLSATPTGTTSSGIWNGSNFNVLGWSNAGGADTNGGTSTSGDSATLLYLRTAGTNVRTIAVDKDNNVWTGGYGNKIHQKYDGETGAALGAPVNLGSNSGYGGLIDGNGVLWSAGWGDASLSRYDPATGTETNHAVGGGSYGLAVDADGNIFNTHLSNSVTKLAPDGTLIWTKTYAGGSGNRGIAVTPDGNLWIGNSYSNTVSRLDNNGNLIANIVCETGPMGISVDSNGKVWATNYYSNSVSRIDPASNLVDLTIELGAGASPYNYSDMTGTVVTGTTSPSGTWRKVLNGGAGATWGQIFWNLEGEGEIPETTGLTVEARWSNDQITWSDYVAYTSAANIGLVAQYLEIRTTLERTGGTALSPILSDLRVDFTPGGGPTVPEPTTAAMLSLGLLGLAWSTRRKNIS